MEACFWKRPTEIKQKPGNVTLGFFSDLSRVFRLGSIGDGIEETSWGVFLSDHSAIARKFASEFERQKEPDLELRERINPPLAQLHPKTALLNLFAASEREYRRFKIF